MEHRGYAVLNPDDQMRIRTERMLTLEGEHYHAGLLIEESVNPDGAIQLVHKQQDLARRIALHREALKGPEPQALEQAATAEP